MPIAQLNNLQIYFERRGEGRPLLFISGTGGDLRNVPNQFDSPLATEFDLICYDQRGLGQSQTPAAEFTMQQYADDAAALLDFLDIDCIPIIGVSFGGMVAQEMLLRHPDRISAAVLACTSAGGEGGASFPLHELAALAPDERIDQHLKAADLRHTEKWIVDHPEAWQKRRQLALKNLREDRDEQGALKQLQARATHDTFARLPQIKHPLLLAGGEFDGIAPMANMQAMAAQMPQAELKYFTGGHMFLLQDRDSYPFIIQWFKENT